MKDPVKKSPRLMIVMATVLCLALGSPLAGQSEDEGDEEQGNRLGTELAATLSALDRWADRYAKVEKGGEVPSGIDEIIDILDSVEDQAPEAKEYFEGKKESGNAGKAGDLKAAAKSAQRAISKSENDAGLIVIVCREVVSVGEDVVAALTAGK